jgi:hypothetical protein
MNRFTMLLGLMCALYLYATPADAQTPVAPPGNSGVSQYLEAVPGAGGNRPYNPRSGGNSHRHVLAKRVQQALTAAGPAGKAAAAFAQTTAPAATGSNHRGRPGSGGAAAPLTAGGGPATPSAIGHGLLGSPGDSVGGLGIALPILLAVMVAGAGLAFLRRRKSMTD